MRPITLTPGSAGRSERVFVYVRDAGGTFRELSSASGWATSSFVDSVTIEEDIDDPHRTATIVFKRELERISLAPLLTGSPLNRGWNPAAAYAPLLKAGRELIVSFGIGTEDSETLVDTVEVFRGRIDRVQSASAEQVEVSCRDLGGRMADTWIEEERVYGLAAVAGAPVPLRIWTPSTAYALNEYVIPTEAKRSISGSPRFYKVTTAGTSGTTEPTWPTSSTVASGSVTFTYQGTTSPDVGYPVETIMQQIISAWLVGVVLITEVSPGWNVTQYLQRREPVLDAVRNLAMQLGWDVRYKWWAGSDAWELMFYEPERTKTTSDATFGASDYEDVSRLEQDISGVRNAWKGVFPDVANKDPEGNPVRGEALVTDATSITEYGRLFAEISEDQLSVINTAAKMTQMLNAALSDTKDPKVEAEVQLVHGWPWVELGDLYRFTANGRHFDGDQDLAVTHHSISFDGGVAKTTLSCRGKPAGAFSRWHDFSGRSRPEGVHPTKVFEAAAGPGLSAKDVIGGTRLGLVAAPEGLARGAEYEFHVSTSSGFTPDASTLKGASRGTSLEVADLVPGKAYFAKVVPRARDASRLARAFPSEQLSFTAARANSGHLVSDVDWGRVPLNGSFETRTDASGPPDHWSMVTGTWVTDIDLLTGSSAVTGDAYLHVKSGTAQRAVETGFFEISSKRSYVLSAYVQGVSGSGDLKIVVQFYLSDFSYDSETGLFFPAGTTTWGEKRMRVSPWSGIKFAKVKIYKDAPSTAGAWYVDSVRLRDLGDDVVVAATVGSFANNWVDYDGTTYKPCGASVDPGGVVHLQGVAKRGSGTTTNGETVLTLQAGARPSRSFRQLVDSSSGPVTLIITSAGLVQWWGGAGVTPTYYSLDGVTFDSL